MRMRAVWFEDHEVGDVHNTHAQLRKALAKERRCCDDFESDFDADAHKHDIWVNAVVYTRELPDRSASDAMLSRD